MANTTSEKLLSRDDFREGVFKRDGHLCVVCKELAVDAHHIIERRLFDDGGYYLSNGASLCEQHHLEAEMTVRSVEELREAAGIAKWTIPSHLYGDQRYDKWGNPIMPNGQRLKGELFWDESVQKILGQGRVLGDFTNQVKYPRTHHLPWSPGITEDDRVLSNLSSLQGRRVIVTEKMDGENTTMYQDYIHARSVDSAGHVSRNWVKNFWSGISADIPEGWRLCGENLFAKHSLHYEGLPTYFMGFSLWNERNVCLSWDETQEWFSLMGVHSVPVIYDGIFDEKQIRSLYKESDWDRREGYVVRTADSFAYSEFRKSVAKFVRSGHVQTVKHWMHGQPVEKNLLAA
jgi:hypothetical protein